MSVAEEWIPACAGMTIAKEKPTRMSAAEEWIPACAGMTIAKESLRA